MCTQGSLRAVSGQIFIFQGSLRADFIRHRRFPCVGHIFWLSGQISGQSTDNTIFNWHRSFPCLGHIQGTQGTQGRFFDITFLYKIQKLKIVKIWNWCDFVIFENVVKNYSFTPMFHYAQNLYKKYHFCQFVWGIQRYTFNLAQCTIRAIFNYTLSLKHK